MKRKTVGLVIVAMALLMMFAAGCRKPWSGDGNHMDRLIAHMDERVETLNLTEPQKAQYEEMKLKLRNNIEEFKQDRQVFFESVKIELSKEDPAMDMLANNVKQRMRDMAEFGAEHVDLFMGFYNLLDENQQAQVVDVIQEKMERHEKWTSKREKTGASE